MADAPLESLRRELSDYVAFRRRGDDPTYDLDKAIRAHRRQCLENLTDTGEEIWTERITLLEQLATKLNYSLHDEPPTWSVHAELKRAEQVRRAEWIERGRRAAQTSQEAMA